MSTPSSPPLELGPDRTFRYRAPSAIDVSALLLCAAWLVMTGARLARSALVRGGLGYLPWQVWAALVVFAAVPVLYLRLLLRQLLLRPCACIEVTRVGIVVCDWRGRATRLFWDEVNEVRHRAPGCLGVVLVRPWSLELRAEGRCLRIPGPIEDGPELREIILACTGCTEETRMGGQVRYTRPGEK
jgi:hypothetical protein